MSEALNLVSTQSGVVLASASTLTDSLLELANGNTADALDVGFWGTYVSSGTKYTGLVRDATDDTYKLFTALTTVPGATTFTAPTTEYADLSVKALNASSDVSIGVTAVGGKKIRLWDSDGAQWTDIKGGDQTQNVTYTLPVDDGTSAQVMSTDGAGVLSWKPPADGALTVITATDAAAPNNDLVVADAGKLITLGVNTTANRVINLPAVATAAGVKYKFLVVASPTNYAWQITKADGVIHGVISPVAAAVAAVVASSATTVNIAAAAQPGDAVTIVSDGANWFVTGRQTVDAIITFT